jgi:hypothetical protein
VGNSLILLDSQSTHSTFCAAELVKNIRNVVRPLRMTTNGGSLVYNQQADLPSYGTVWYNPKSIANIISMSEAERRGHEITYSPGCFRLINKQMTLDMSFRMSQAGLYTYTAPPTGLSLVQTVSENSQFFTPRQIEAAKLARNMYEMIGRPSYGDFIAIIKNNLLPNANITIKDVDHAERIFGKELGSIQGKTVRSRPNVVVTDYIQVPPDIMELHSYVTIAIDIMNVDRMQFLITTSRDIQFTTVDRLDSKDTRNLMIGIERIISLYQKRAFVVQTCLADNEFESLRGSLLHLGVNLNVCAPGEHIPEVERKIRTVKERVRAVITTLPFRAIPLIVTAHAVVFSVMWINFFPPKGGLSSTLSPQAIVTGLSPNAEKHCRIPFGAYAQVHVDNTQSNNAMISRTVGAISLGPTGNIQGTYKFMSLLTGKLIKARSFTSLPMPKEVVKQVEEMATSNSSSKQDETHVDFTSIRGDYQVVHEEDDISLGSSEYSKISKNELSDLRIDDQVENTMDNNAAFPETVLSYDNNNDAGHLSLEDPEIQGVDDKISNEHESDISDHQEEDIYENTIDDQDNDNIEENNNNNSNLDPNEQEDISGLDTIDESSRTHYVTRKGRNVKLRKDLFDNYEFLQGDMKNVLNLDKTKGISTQWSLRQGLRFYPEETKKATITELSQLHQMNVFQPIHKSSMTRQEIIGTLNTLTFIKRKRCGRVKARTCADGRPQRSLFQKWESSSPTVRTESVLITSLIDSYERRRVGVYDIPGAFLHAKQTDLT